MKIRTLIEKLLINNDLDDEIVVDWFEKSMYEELLINKENDYTREEFDKSWLAIQEQAGQELSHFLSHYDLCNDIGNFINDEIEEKRKNG